MPHAVQNTRIPDNEPVSVIYGPQAQLAIQWQPQHPQSAGIRHCLQTVGHKLVLLSTWTKYGSHLLSLLFNSCLCHTAWHRVHGPSLPSNYSLLRPPQSLARQCIQAACSSAVPTKSTTQLSPDRCRHFASLPRRQLDKKKLAGWSVHDLRHYKWILAVKPFHTNSPTGTLPIVCLTAVAGQRTDWSPGISWQPRPRSTGLG